MSRKALGTLLVCISGTAFGAYSYFALLADKNGVGPVSLLMFRFLIAGVILGAIALIVRAKLPKRSQLLPLLLLGMCYVGQSFTYLQCLRYSNPITASLLLYLYPVWVTLGSVLFLHEKMTRVKVVALVCAFIGSILIIGPVAEIGGAAVLYGLATSLFYAAYLVYGKKSVGGIHPVMSTLVIIFTAAAAFGLGAAGTGLQVPSNTYAWLGVGGLAVVATVIAIGTLIAGLDMITPVEASSLSALEPLVSAIIAVTVLGTQLQVGHVLGGALVIAAVVLLARQAGKTEREGPNGNIP